MPLDLPSQIVQKIDAIGVSSNFLAKMYGCSTGQMAQYLNGNKVLPQQIGVEILELVKKLEHLTKLAGPLPLVFKDEAVIRDLLTKIDDANLTILVKDHTKTAGDTGSEKKFGTKN